MREGKFKFVLMCTSVLCVSAIEQSNQRIFAIPVASRCRRIVTFRVGVCVCAIVCSFGTAALCFFFLLACYMRYIYICTHMVY